MAGEDFVEDGGGGKWCVCYLAMSEGTPQRMLLTQDADNNIKKYVGEMAASLVVQQVPRVE